MQIAYPKSFLTLLLIGFSLIALPFLFALGNATLYLGNISEQSRTAVTKAVQATRDSRALVEQLTLLERLTRQYMAVGDNRLLESFGIAHRKFDDTASNLGSLPLEKPQLDTLNRVTTSVDKLGVRIALGDQQELGEAIAEFGELYNMANSILAASNQMIDHETQALQIAAENAQRRLMWQALSLVPFTLIVTMAITYLIGRPLRQIELVIHNLGNAKLKDKIDITGPDDLRKLGERLDWLREQLASLEAQKSRFLREVSHELKTPLTAIRESAELLNERIAGSLTPKQQEIVGILHSNSLKLQHMIEDLLNYNATHLQSPTVFQTVQMHSILRSVLTDHALTISSRHIRLISSIGHLTLAGDEAKLTTLCDNLISNAIKFAPQGGTVRVSLGQENGKAILDVHDNGPGIEPRDRPHVFEPFFQGSAPQGGVVKGSGLGLSIARDCVSAHGGEIEIVDMPQLGGALFRVILPMTSATSII